MSVRDSKYAVLFEAYCAELEVARREVTAWWAALLEEVGGDEARVRPRWPSGPTSHPRVLGVYRRYHLSVVALNERGHEQQSATPEVWGRADEPIADDYEWTPAAVLLDSLEHDSPELDAFMFDLVLPPTCQPLHERYPAQRWGRRLPCSGSTPSIALRSEWSDF